MWNMFTRGIYYMMLLMLEETHKNCKGYSLIKPRFLAASTAHLIKAAHLWQQIRLDHKGPLPLEGKNTNIFMLPIIDQFSKMPFTFAVPDIGVDSTTTYLLSLFSLHWSSWVYTHQSRFAFMSHNSKRGTPHMGSALPGQPHISWIGTEMLNIQTKLYGKPSVFTYAQTIYQHLIPIIFMTVLLPFPQCIHTARPDMIEVCTF